MKIRQSVLILLGAAVFFSTASAQQPAANPKKTPTQEEKDQFEKAQKQKLVDLLPPGTTKVFDAAYVEGAHLYSSAPGSIQNLDLYIPAGNGPFPLIIYIHGGGWNTGNKEIGGTKWATGFVPHGFAVASLNYRFTRSACFPAQVEDCNAALVWLRKHAAEYHLDPNRVGVMGESAGAHLAALMGATGDSARFYKGTDGSVRVQAVLALASPFDLDRDRGHWSEKSFMWQADNMFCKTFFSGAVYDGEQARQASPASYVHPGMPPFLIIHGGKDTLVPLVMVSTFADNLKKAGVDVTFSLDPDHGHGDLSSGSSNIEKSISFFARTLHSKPSAP